MPKDNKTVSVRKWKRKEKPTESDFRTSSDCKLTVMRLLLNVNTNFLIVYVTSNQGRKIHWNMFL